MNPRNDPPWLHPSSETGALVRAFDWSRTPLGAIQAWPSSLTTIVAAMLNSRHPMFLWWGPELIQIYNDAYVPSFGVGKHPRAMGQRGAECWQEAWDIIGAQIDAVMKRGESTWNEDQLVCIWRNDRLEEVYWTYGYSPVYGDGSEVAGTLVVCTETTPRVLAERRLRTLRALTNHTANVTTTAELLDAAVDVLGRAEGDTPFVLFYLVDETNNALVLSKSAGLGNEHLHIADRAFRALAPAQARTIHLGQALPGGLWPEGSSVVFVSPLPHEAGSIVFGLSSRLPFDDAYREYLVQVTEQIAIAVERVATLRVREATAIERNNLLMQAPVATALFRGPEHVFELANTLYCKMVNRFDIVGKTYREAFPELVDTELPALLDNVYNTGVPFSSGEMLVPLDKRGDGTLEECYFTFNLEALRDPQGRVYGMMAVALEITDQVRARQADARAQLDREALLQELQTASRAKDEFLAMLGHELRNPLSPIVTALHLMRSRSSGTASRELDIIERQVEHLVRLVDDLLDVSKMTRGKVVLKKEIVELSDVVAKAVEIASDLFEQRRHRLVVDVPKVGLRVHGDPVRLSQIIANFLTNAARYTEPGGVVTVSASREGDIGVVIVKDNGLGIAPEMLTNIFDLFVQGQRSNDRREGGLGLGLWLVQRLVAMHGGTVVARSDGLNQGSEFEMRLPITDSTASGASADEPLRSGDGTRRRILVVDDNVDAAELLHEAFRAFGHEVAVAHDGITALALAASFEPEVALLDIGLPVMDGYELAAHLRADPKTAHCTLIALTGYGQDNDRARTKAAGFDIHLVKPVDLDELIKIVANPQATG